MRGTRYGGLWIVAPRNPSEMIQTQIFRAGHVGVNNCLGPTNIDHGLSQVKKVFFHLEIWLCLFVLVQHHWCVFGSDSNLLGTLLLGGGENLAAGLESL
jgi:hypothetical protein